MKHYFFVCISWPDIKSSVYSDSPSHATHNLVLVSAVYCIYKIIQRCVSTHNPILQHIPYKLFIRILQINTVFLNLTAHVHCLEFEMYEYCFKDTQVCCMVHFLWQWMILTNVETHLNFSTSRLTILAVANERGDKMQLKKFFQLNVTPPVRESLP